MSRPAGLSPDRPAIRAIRAWPPAERPRERLRTVGPAGVSTRELLAVLVGSGGRSGSAVDVAEAVLSQVDGSLRRLAAAPSGFLERVPGVGAATAARVSAALELGRRAATEPSHTGAPIRGPADVRDRMAPRLRDLRHEEFHALLLNTRHAVLRAVLVTRGVLDASLIHPREVLREAIVEGAAAVVLVHNHPSGDPSPSPEDRAVTRQLADAGRAVGIPVLDHVIVAGTSFHSLAQEGASVGLGTA